MERALTPNLMDLLLDTVCVVDDTGRFVFVSASCEQLLGYTPDELVGRNMIELVHPDDRARTLAAAAEIMDGQPKTHFENRYVRKDGRAVDIMWSARWSPQDRLRLAVARDVTVLKRAQHMQRAVYRISEAAHAAEGLPALFGEIHCIINEMLPAENFSVVLHDRADGTVSLPYHAGEQPPGLRPPGLIPGTPIARVIESGEALLTKASPQGHCEVPLPGDRANWLGVPLVANQSVMGALVVHDHADQRGYTDEDRELLQFVSTQIALATERKQAEERLRYMARHDALTGLPNRALFQDRLDTALRRARRDGEYLALCYLDLNAFKEVNDAFGHHAGDQLLQAIAHRLLASVRQSDTVGRMGGDEFTILMTNIRGPNCMPAAVKKIRKALEQPLQLYDGHKVVVSASIGVAVFPDDGEERDQLFRQADASMYADKRQRDARGPA